MFADCRTGKLYIMSGVQALLLYDMMAEFIIRVNFSGKPGSCHIII